MATREQLADWQQRAADANERAKAAKESTRQKVLQTRGDQRDIEEWFLLRENNRARAELRALVIGLVRDCPASMRLIEEGTAKAMGTKFAKKWSATWGRSGSTVVKGTFRSDEADLGVEEAKAMIVGDWPPPAALEREAEEVDPDEELEEDVMPSGLEREVEEEEEDEEDERADADGAGKPVIPMNITAALDNAFVADDVPTASVKKIATVERAATVPRSTFQEARPAASTSVRARTEVPIPTSAVGIDPGAPKSKGVAGVMKPVEDAKVKPRGGHFVRMDGADVWQPGEADAMVTPVSAKAKAGASAAVRRSGTTAGPKPAGARSGSAELGAKSATVPASRSGSPVESGSAEDLKAEREARVTKAGFDPSFVYDVGKDFFILHNFEPACERCVGRNDATNCRWEVKPNPSKVGACTICHKRKQLCIGRKLRPYHNELLKVHNADMVAMMEKAKTRNFKKSKEPKDLGHGSLVKERSASAGNTKTKKKRPATSPIPETSSSKKARHVEPESASAEGDEKVGNEKEEAVAERPFWQFEDVLRRPYPPVYAVARRTKDLAVATRRIDILTEQVADLSACLAVLKRHRDYEVLRRVAEETAHPDKEVERRQVPTLRLLHPEDKKVDHVVKLWSSGDMTNEEREEWEEEHGESLWPSEDEE